MTHTGNDYSISIDEAGDYVITVAPVDNTYYGEVTLPFTVYESYRIVVSGNYPFLVSAAELNLLPANVYGGTTIIEDKTVSVSVLKENGSDWQAVEGITGGKFTPTAGKYKIVYSADGIADVEKTFTVRGEIKNVFDPAAADAGDKTGTSGTAFAGTERTFVSADDNNDSVYGGAYVQYTVPGTTWANVKITPEFERAQYADFDYVSIWVQYVRESGAADVSIKIAPGNTVPHRRYVMTGAWTELILIKPIDGMTGTYADNVFFENKIFGNNTAKTFDFNYFISMKFEDTNTKYVRIGEIKAGKFVDDDKSTTNAFAPTAANVATNVGGAGSINVSAENPDADGAYTGACVSWTPAASGWQNMYLTPTDGDWKSLSGYQQLKIWMYVQSSATEIQFAMFNEASSRQKVETNKWVEVTMDIGMYTEYIVLKPVASGSSGNPYFMSHNAWGGATVYIGTVTAVRYV